MVARGATGNHVLDLRHQHMASGKTPSLWGGGASIQPSCLHDMSQGHWEGLRRYTGAIISKLP